MPNPSRSTLLLLPLAGFCVGLAVAGALNVTSAKAQGAPATQDPVTSCVLHNIDKIQNVAGHATFSPLTWLIEECRRNPALRS